MKRGKYASMLGLLIYVCTSALGLTLIKIGTGKGTGFALSKTGFELRLNWILLLGMTVYVLSFLLSLVVMSRMNLSLFYPLSAGAIYIVICVVSFFVLHEKISINQLVGMGVILVGIVIMNLAKN